MCMSNKPPPILEDLPEIKDPPPYYKTPLDKWFENRITRPPIIEDPSRKIFKKCTGTFGFSYLMTNSFLSFYLYLIQFSMTCRFTHAVSDRYFFSAGRKEI
jgi:hypothetical protein